MSTSLKDLSSIQYSVITQGSNGKDIKNKVCIDVSDAYWGLDQLLSIHGIKTPKGFANWKGPKHSPSGKKYSHSNLFLVFDKGSIEKKVETFRIGSIPQFLTLEELQKQKKVNINFKSIKGADHFYENFTEQFSSTIDSYIKESLADLK